MKSTNLHKENTLLIYVKYATFVKRDKEILEKKYVVTNYHFNTAKKWYLPFAFLKQFFYLLFVGFRFKNYVIQSSGYVSFFPVIFGKLYGKKVVIIAIGTDCAKLPEINYGAFVKPILSWFTAFSFKNCDLILPVHKSLAKSNYTYLDVAFKKQGILNLIPNCKTKIKEVVNGYNSIKWKLLNLSRKENSFLTVTFALDTVGIYRKGIDMIVTLARLHPNFSFTIVGNVNLQDYPKNITLISNVPQKELLKIYNQHKYYLQLSMFEGFPNALCEAMLCGCIPIGSDVAGIPDIIGEFGYVLKQKSIEKIESIIKDLDKNNFTEKEVRNQILQNFPLQRREKELLELVSLLNTVN